MKRILSTLLLTAVMVFSSFAAHAAPVEVGVLDFPPYYQVKASGEVMGGLYAEMLTKILKKAGIDHVIKGFPAKRLYTNVADGTTHVWMGTTGVVEYEGKALVSPVNTSEIQLTVYGLGDQASLPKSLDELKGKSLITIYGYNYGGVIKFLTDPANNIAAEPAQEHEQAFKMLAAGRAPLLLDYEEPASEALKASPVPNVKKSIIKRIPIYIIVSKAAPDAQGLMDKMMKAYEELKAAGQI